MSDDFRTKDFIIGTMTGAVIGAILAFIFAPKSGKDLRGDIEQQTSKLKYQATEWKDIAQEKSSNWKEKAYTTTEEFKQRAMITTSRISEKAQQLTKSDQKRPENIGQAVNKTD